MQKIPQMSDVLQRLIAHTNINHANGWLSKKY